MDLASMIRLPELRSNNLTEEQAHIRKNAVSGVTCPCCGRLVKVYERHLNASMAASLIWLVTECAKGRSWVDVPKRAPRYVMSNRELSRLVHWDLVMTKEPQSDEKRSSGLWAPTQTGVDFVFEKLEVPASVFIFNNEVIAKNERLIGVRGALKTRFDYNKLMGRA